MPYPLWIGNIEYLLFFKYGVGRLSSSGFGSSPARGANVCNLLLESIFTSLGQGIPSHILPINKSVQSTLTSM
jgi:hypothetical protein